MTLDLCQFVCFILANLDIFQIRLSARHALMDASHVGLMENAILALMVMY